MIWPSVVFNLCVGLLLAAYLLRAVRRFERTADRIMAKLDQRHTEELRKFDIAREEIRESMRAQVDSAIAEMNTMTGEPAVSPTGRTNTDTVPAVSLIHSEPSRTADHAPTAPAEGS